MEFDRTRFRRSRTIVLYWKDGQLVVENYRRRIKIASDPEVFSVLDFFGEWRSPSQLYASMTGYDRRSVAAELRRLVQFGVLVERGSREATLDLQLDKVWSPWLPAAGFLHFSCKDGRYLSPDEARSFRQQLARGTPPPPRAKHYPRAPQVKLPIPNTSGALSRVLLERRTWRQFSPRPVELTDLATILWTTWGVQAWWDVGRPIGRVALKTSPSAGGCNPIEVYVSALRVSGLRPGLYHYAADRHRLEMLRPGTSARRQEHYLAKQSWFGPAAAVVFMTAIFSRSQWKYKDAGTYRAILVDAGHLCQTFCLMATSLGLAPFCTQALADSLIETDLGLDGVSESVLYAAGLGVRPSGVSWAPGNPVIASDVRRLAPR